MKNHTHKYIFQEEVFKDIYNKIPVELWETMLNFKPRVINTKDPEIKKLVKNKGSKIWGVIKLLDEIWDIKEPSAKKIKSIIKDYFGDILKDKTKREEQDIIVGLAEYLRDTTGLKTKEWEKAEEELKKEGFLKIGGKTMDALEIIKEKGRWEGERKGLKEGRQEGIQEGMQKVALNLLKENMNISVISKVTGLPANKIKKLKNGS